MKPMRKKPFQYLFIVAASVATIAFIKNCHTRSSSSSILWSSNKNQRKSTAYSKKTQYNKRKIYKNEDPEKHKYGPYYYSNNTYNRSRNYIKRNPNKPISPKMAYQLLQILWGESQKNRNLLLQKLQKDSIQFQSELLSTYENQTPKLVDFNPNDSLQWFNIPGFSRKHWYSIKKYRDRLGGFQNLNQIQEIPKLDTFIKIVAIKKLSPTPSIGVYRKISSQSTWKELYQHPYIGSQYAKIIFAYYQTHPKPSREELLLIQGIPSSHLQRLWPYLSKNKED